MVTWRKSRRRAYQACHLRQDEQGTHAGAAVGAHQAGLLEPVLAARP